MLNLPKSTEMSKQLPKKAIYAKFNLSNAAKEKFDADISKITIVGEISPNTTTLQKGEKVSAFFLLLVNLKQKGYDEKNIIMLSKLIPQNILFILEYEERCQLAVYRTRLICSDWKPVGDWDIKLEGLSLDTVWENVAIQVGDIKVSEDNTLDEQIIIDERREKVLKEIERLEKKARSEVQPRKKMEVVKQISLLKKELLGK